MPAGVTTRPPWLAASRSGSAASSPISLRQRADHELAHRERRALGEERLDPQILVDALDLRGVDRAVGLHGQPTVVDFFAGELARTERPPRCPRQRRVADRPQVTRDLVGQHLLQSEAEQMRGVAAVGPREDVTAAARRAARSPVTGGTAVGKPGDDRGVALRCRLRRRRFSDRALRLSEFALEELAAAHDRAERIARDQKSRGIRGDDVAAPAPICSSKRLVNAGADRVRRLGEVAFLSARAQA